MMHRSRARWAAQRLVVSSVPQRPEEVALVEAVLTAFPTAHFTFFPSAKPVPSPDQPKTSHGGAERMLNTLDTLRRSDAVLHVPRDHLQTEVAPGTLWDALHRRRTPLQRSAAPGAYPRCRFRPPMDSPQGERSGLGKEASHDAQLHQRQHQPQLTRTEDTPMWVPHAVVAVGGFDGADLRRTVLPSLVEHVPALPDALHRRSNSAAAAAAAGNHQEGHIETVRGRRRMPSYFQKKFLERNVFLDKGCAVLGASVLELSLPVGSTAATVARRERVFVAFANNSGTVSGLLRERQPSRRALLRAGFGVSLPLLQQALPLALVMAVMAIRAWASSTRRLPDVSSAFWISALARYVSQTPVEVSVAAWEGQGVPAVRALLDTLRHKLMSRTDDEVRLTAEEEDLLAHCLAGSVIRWVADASQQEWSDTLLQNYFLPAEDFSALADVQELRQHRAALTSPNGLESAAWQRERYHRYRERVTSPLSV